VWVRLQFYCGVWQKSENSTTIGNIFFSDTIKTREIQFPFREMRLNHRQESEVPSQHYAANMHAVRTEKKNELIACNCNVGGRC